MYSDKLSVIGDKGIVLGFKAAGMDGFAAANDAQAEARVEKQAKNNWLICVTKRHTGTQTVQTG